MSEVGHYSSGLAGDCEECKGTSEEGFFSRYSCIECKALAGFRYPAHTVYTDHTFEHIDVCQDCVERMS